MKRLILISALLLFASNGWADDDKYCYTGDVSESTSKPAMSLEGIKNYIKQYCEEGDILYLRIYGKDKEMRSNFISALFCDFEKQIIITGERIITGPRGSSPLYQVLQCVLKYNKARLGRQN